MEITTFMIIKLGVVILIGFFAGPAAVYAFNKMPASWLCEWNQKPSQELLDPRVKRIKENPWRWVFSAWFICLAIRLVMADLGDMTNLQSLQLAAVGLPVCWVLLLIGLGDYRFMIIPDQLVLALALLAVGRAPFYEGVMEQVLGLAIGGGFMLMVAGLGSLISKKEVLGFGDVKLCAALGLVMGTKGIICTLVVAVIISGIRALIAVITKRNKRGDMMPLGPYICGSAMAYILICWPFSL